MFQTLNALEGGGLGGGDLAARMLTRVAAPLWLMRRWGTWGWGFQEGSSSSRMFHCSFSSMSSVLFVKTKYSRKISSLCSTRDRETQNDEWSHDLRTCTSLHNLDKQGVALPLPPELGDLREQCPTTGPWKSRREAETLWDPPSTLKANGVKAGLLDICVCGHLTCSVLSRQQEQSPRKGVLVTNLEDSTETWLSF